MLFEAVHLASGRGRAGSVRRVGTLGRCTGASGIEEWVNNGNVSRLCEEVHRGDSDYPSKEAKGGARSDVGGAWW